MTLLTRVALGRFPDTKMVLGTLCAAVVPAILTVSGARTLDWKITANP